MCVNGVIRYSTLRQSGAKLEQHGNVQRHDEDVSGAGQCNYQCFGFGQGNPVRKAIRYIV